jgi:hypothetical protein
VIFGVSPAWFLSFYGEAFSVVQAGESLGLLSSLGFTNWQSEIFLEDGLDEWVSGKAECEREFSLISFSGCMTSVVQPFFIVPSLDILLL